MSPEPGDKSLSERRAFSSAVMWAPIKAHAFTVTAGKQGPESINSLRTTGSFFKKKKEELTVRSILLWDIPMRGGCAQPHADRNKANHFPTKACPTSLAPCLSPLGHRLLRPMSQKVSSQQSPSTRVLQILQSFVQCHNWGPFEVLFSPQLLASLTSSQSVVFASPIMEILPPVFGCLHCPKGFSSMTSLWLSYSPAALLISL